MMLSLALVFVPVSIVPVLSGNTTSPAQAAMPLPATVDSSLPAVPGLTARFWWEDFDRDGLPDAFAIASNGTARLLRNQGDGSFADVTLISGLDTLSAANFAAWYDFDRDGAPDLFVGSQAGPGRLMRNARDGTFQDVTEIVGLSRAGHALEAQWLDYDRDRLNDLALRTDAGEELYHALPSGMFEAVDLGLARSLTDAPVGLSDTEVADEVARDATATDTPAANTTTKHRRPKLAGATLPLTPSSSTPIPPTWSSSGVPNASVAACVDLIKNQATATCIQVSSTPTLGWLYPLTTNLNVSVAGNVGIGTTTPTFKLDVAGTARISDTLTLNPASDLALDVSTGSIYKGGLLFAHTKGLANNTALGVLALSSVTNGFGNTATGREALQSDTTGFDETAVGFQALSSNTNGGRNTAIGSRALRSNTSGTGNTASGHYALRTNTTGGKNTASGTQALFYNTTGSDNAAHGYQALYSNTIGAENTASGFRTLKYNSSGSRNTASGSQALYFNTTGSGNTASGYRALVSNRSGQFNTAVGSYALSSNTTGTNNTASGSRALRVNTTGSGNNASGYLALSSNTTGYNNTASGLKALSANTTGSKNTASGYQSLAYNTTGRYNTAAGGQALFGNTTGAYNTANGARALASNTVGSKNTASGFSALLYNSSGFANTASGFMALANNGTGTGNTASGYQALRNVQASENTADGQGALLNDLTGGFNTAIGSRALEGNQFGFGNIALGYMAGTKTTGNNNIAIGNPGALTESGTIRIGGVGAQTRAFISGIRGVTTGVANGIPVLIDSNGQLGTVSSSRRFKKDIRDMGDATAKLLELRPVLFNYKQEQTMPDGSAVPPEYGLIAEEVAEIMPDLVVYDDAGKPFTVKYHMLSSMLLNEMKKMHERLKQQDERLRDQGAVQAVHARDLAGLRSELMLLREHEARLAALESRVAPAAQPTTTPHDVR